MGGRPRKPIELKLLQGTLDNRRVPASPAVLPSISSESADALNPPDDLPEDARNEWARIAATLEKAGLFKQVDKIAFKTFCLLYSQFEVATRDINKKGLMLKVRGFRKRYIDERGNPVTETRNEETIQNPAFSVQMRCADLMRRYLVEFGMTPASRSRIDLGLPKQSAEDKPKSGFAGMA